MSTYPSRDDDRFRAEMPTAPPASGMSGCLKGCLIALVVLVLLVIVLGVWAWFQWRNWAATAGSAALKEAIAQMELPPEEVVDINLQIDRVADAFRNKQLSAEQLARLINNLADSPLLTTFVGSAVNAKYISKSGLSPEEKTAASQTLRRFLRGIVDKKIPEAAVNHAMSYVADRDTRGNWRLRDQISDDELRKFLEVAKDEADRAQIPDEPEDFDPSDEMKRIVDETLNPGSTVKPEGDLPAEQPPKEEDARAAGEEEPRVEESQAKDVPAEDVPAEEPAAP